MKKQASVGLVVVFLLLAVGFVYALSTTTSPPRKGPAAITEQPAPSASPAEPPAPEVSFSPDITKVDPTAFLDPVPVGKAAPDFSAKTADGKTLKLSEFKGRKNVVLIFYQGSFCSVCAAQLSNLQAHLADFKAQDAEVMAISADDMQHAQLRQGESGLSFNVIPDPDKQIIKKFGIGNISKKGIAWPSAFIVDKKGLVQLSYADKEGHRLHSNELLPILSKITGKPAPKLTYEQ